MSKKFRIGGVPEHFNLPWHLCMEEGLFADAGIYISWKDFPGGTGAMTRELRHDGLDIAIVLTEGMIADIALGNKTKIIGFYTKTPLIWGVHTSAYNRFEVIKDVDPPIFAISRYGSGSHLMAYVFAKNQGWNPKTDIQFKVVGNLDGARESLAEQTSNLFLWEKFTTKPFVDNGDLKRLTNQPTPWPCFVVAVREEVLTKHKDDVYKILDIVFARAEKLRNQDNCVELLSERYEQKPEDIKEWLSITEWNSELDPDNAVIDNVIDTLTDLNIIKKEIAAEEVLSI